VGIYFVSAKKKFKRFISEPAAPISAKTRSG
jgi:hypothetical protein